MQLSLTAMLDGKKVWAKDMLDRNLNYLDEVNQKMILVKGKVKIDHFRHYPNQFSLYETEHDTIEHDQGKQIIYSLFKNKSPCTDVEVIKPEIKRRGDIVIPEQSLNVEYQCASISIDEIENRTKDWDRIGYRTLWVFGTKNYFRKVYCENYRLKEPELYCLRKNGCVFYNNGNYLIQCMFCDAGRFVKDYWTGEEYWKDYKKIKELYREIKIKPGNKYSMVCE